MKAFRQHSEIPITRRFAIAVLAAVAIAAARYALRGVLGDAAPFLPFLAAVVVSAWAGGFWPGVLTAVVSAGLGVLLFPGGHTMLELHHPPRGLAAVLFVLVGAVFSGVCETMHRSLARVEAHRKELLAEIANRRAVEESLASERRMLEEIARTTPGIVYLFDLVEGRAVYVNPGVEQILGYSAEEIVSSGAVLDRLLEPERPASPGKSSSPFRSLADGEVYDHVVRIRHACGEHRWLHCRDVIFARDEAGNPTRFLGTAYDVTQQHEAAQALQDADRRKDEFIATLSHELRNPLAPIRSAVEVLRRKPELDEAVGRLCGVIGRQADHMTRLVDELLDLSRITRGKIELRREPISLDMVVHAALEVAGPAIEAGGHALTVETPPRPPFVHGDAVRLTQAVANLLNNAARYTPHGGRIALLLEAEGNTAVIRVRDTGIGIPPAMHEEIFSMFSQVDRDPGRAQGGLGIGLSLVKSLVELHGGTVTVQSEGEGCGAEFAVRLPLLPVGESLPPPQEASGSVPVWKCRVMIVDDNRDAAESLAELLEVDGHEVCAALSGRDALRQFAHFAPQLVLLDLGMPGMDGFQTLAELRKLPGGADVCVSALTGWGQDEDRRRTTGAGFDHHLTKPVDLGSLQELIGRVAR